MRWKEKPYNPWSFYMLPRCLPTEQGGRTGTWVWWEWVRHEYVSDGNYSYSRWYDVRGNLIGISQKELVSAW